MENLRKQHKVYSAHNAPRGKTAKSGEKIYKYKYVDKETNKVVETEINQQQKIESYIGLTDYKNRIKNGEEVLVNGNTGELIKDYRSLPADKVALIDFINMASNLSEDEIANFIQQASEGNEVTIEEGQSFQETPNTTIQEQPTSSEPAATITSQETGGF
jgi:hypothetical protein